MLVKSFISQMGTHRSFLMPSYMISCITQLLNFLSFARSKCQYENGNIANNCIQRLFISFYWSAVPRHFHYQGIDKILQGMEFYASNSVKVNGTAHMSDIIHIFKSF